MVIEHVTKKAGDSGVRLPLDNPQVMEALRHGRIEDAYEILRKEGISVKDFEDFAKAQHTKYLGEVVQREPVYEMDAAVPPPNPDDFPQHDQSNTLDSEDQGYFAGISKAMVSKAQGELPSDVEAKIRTDLESWDVFNRELNNRIFDIQLTMELKAKEAELQKDLDRIKSLVASGAVDPVFYILALTKYNVMRDGLVFAQVGRRIMRINDEMNQVTASLKGLDPNDPRYFAVTQEAQIKTREGATNIQIQTMNMQQVAQSVQGHVSFGDTASKEIFKFRAEMIRKLNVGGS